MAEVLEITSPVEVMGCRSGRDNTATVIALGEIVPSSQKQDVSNIQNESVKLAPMETPKIAAKHIQSSISRELVDIDEKDDSIEEDRESIDGSKNKINTPQYIPLDDLWVVDPYQNLELTGGRHDKGRNLVEVYRNIVTNKLVVVKKICKDKHFLYEVCAYEVDSIRNELPHLYALSTRLVKGNPCGGYLVMEHCPLGDLFDILVIGYERPHPESVICHIFIQMALIIQKIHQASWIHGDVKLENYLVGSDGRLRICDFDLAFCCDYTKHPRDIFYTSRVYGSTTTCPPEIASRKVGFPGDIWMLGVALYGMLTRRYAMHIKGGIVYKEYRDYTNQTEADPFNGDECTVSDDVQKLISWMLRPVARDRPTIAEVLETSWVVEHSKNPLTTRLEEDTWVFSDSTGVTYRLRKLTST